MKNDRNSIIYDKSFKFAIKTVNLYKHLCTKQKEYVLSKQLLRSGTSIGANINEALEAQTRKDFIAKLAIALKEASETRYWINLIVATEYLEREHGEILINELTEIIKILNKMIKTAKQNLEKYGR